MPLAPVRPGGLRASPTPSSVLHLGLLASLCLPSAAFFQTRGSVLGICGWQRPQMALVLPVGRNHKCWSSRSLKSYRDPGRPGMWMEGVHLAEVRTLACTCHLLSCHTLRLPRDVCGVAMILTVDTAPHCWPLAVRLGSFSPNAHHPSPQPRGQNNRTCLPALVYTFCVMGKCLKAQNLVLCPGFTTAWALGPPTHNSALPPGTGCTGPCRGGRCVGR